MHPSYEPDPVSTSDLDLNAMQSNASLNARLSVIAASWTIDHGGTMVPKGRGFRVVGLCLRVKNRVKKRKGKERKSIIILQSRHQVPSQPKNSPSIASRHESHSARLLFCLSSSRLFPRQALFGLETAVMHLEGGPNQRSPCPGPRRLLQGPLYTASQNRGGPRSRDW